MPLPRRKDDGSSGAPVLNLLSARVKLIDVEEYEKPYTVTRKSDGAEFTLDPGFKCTIEVIDDGQGGADNGAQFFEQFKYKNAKKLSRKIGDDSIAELDASDLEGFEMMCRIKPKKNPSTGAVTGSTIDWETMRPVPTREKLAAAATEEEEDFSDIP